MSDIIEEYIMKRVNEALAEERRQSEKILAADFKKPEAQKKLSVKKLKEQ